MRRLESLKIAHWLILVIGLCVTLLVWESTRRDASKRLQEEFDFRVRQVVGRVERRFQDSGMILRGVAGLFSASNEVTGKEFHAYVDSLQLLKNYPGINSLGMGMLVFAKSKAQFLNRQRLDGFPEYHIWPTGDRDEYAPVVFLEPNKNPNLRTFGFDMYSEAMRRTAMQEARDIDGPAMTGEVRLVSGSDEELHSAFIIYVPVFIGGVAHDTLEHRRANIAGWVYLSFRMDETVQGILGESMGNLSDSLSFTIFEGNPTSVGKMVFSSQAKNKNSIDMQGALFHSTLSTILSNKPFTLQMHSLPAFESRLSESNSGTVLLGGITISILFSLIAWMLVNGRERAVLIAKGMSDELIGREKRYRQMFEDNASIAYILDPESGKIIDTNAVAANFWGYSIEELRSMNIADINIAAIEELQTGLLQQLEAGDAGQFTFRHRLKNGEIRDVEISRSFLSDQNQTFIYCIAHDVTSRKQVEKDLCESQAKLQAIIETAMDAVVQLDSNGIIIDWNTRAEKIFGWLRQDAIGQAMIDSIIPTQYQIAYLDGVKQFLDGEEGAVRHSQFEIVAKHRDGYEFPVEVAITTMIGSNGQSKFCVFMHDITNRKKSENALRKARVELENRVFERTAELVRTNRRLNLEIAERTKIHEALEQSQETLRQLVAHQDRIRETERKRIAREIHDELGQHLLVLRIDVSMLARYENEHPKLDERIDAILQHIDTTMRSLRAIINNLRPSVLDLGLYTALEWQAAEFQRCSGIACELVADDEDMVLEDDVATVLFRILQEALTNVLRHAKASQVQIELHRDLTGLVMTIADNGIGMQNAQRSAQNSFGLVGIRERLYILGGELNIESNSSGTVLTVTLPLAS